MNAQLSFKELSKHGSSDYPFAIYHITSDSTKEFATNHWHDQTEIVYIIKGSISISINENTFIGSPGDIFIINSGDIHEIYGIQVPLEYSALVFDFGMLTFQKNDLAQQTFFEPILKGDLQFSNSIGNNKKAFKLLKHIHKINVQKPMCYVLSTKAALIDFFADIIEENKFILKHANRIDKKKELLKSVIKYIDENYADALSLEKIAMQFYMSKKYFCRFFKNNFHKTFIEYLNDVRIENSAHLLLQKDISITQAATSCGFSSMSYFTSTFKKKIGCTPSEYKKLNGYS